jgi:hypothetical protein
MVSQEGIIFPSRQDITVMHQECGAAGWASQRSRDWCIICEMEEPTEVSKADIKNDHRQQVSRN